MKERIKKTLFTIKENKNTQITHLDSKNLMIKRKQYDKVPH